MAICLFTIPLEFFNKLFQPIFQSIPYEKTPTTQQTAYKSSFAAKGLDTKTDVIHRCYLVFIPTFCQQFSH